jgi:eukaryotic-like serine/threonine-protein kinase
VFDGTLKQALTADLEQSPFLNVLSDQKVSATLKLMGRSAAERVTQEAAREICIRTGSKALLAGSIAQPGEPLCCWTESRKLPHGRFPWKY